MAVQHIAIGLGCALAGIGGVGVGSKLLHDHLYPIGSPWYEPNSTMEFAGENWEKAFLDPGMCIRKMFPQLVDSGFFVLKSDIKVEKVQALTPITVFEGDKPKTGHPAIGCMVMNLKKVMYKASPNSLWRGVMRGEFVLSTENEAWIWIMGQSSGKAYLYKHIVLQRDWAKKTWNVKRAVAGITYSDINNFPSASHFWNMNFHKNPELECVYDKDRYLFNEIVCQAINETETISENWAGVWVEGAGNQKYSGWTTNPSDVVFAWSPKNRAQTDFSGRIDKAQFRAQIHDGKGWYIDKGTKIVKPIVWKWDDQRKGLWINIDDLCTNKKLSGTHREYSDSLSDTFCQTK